MLTPKELTVVQTTAYRRRRANKLHKLALTNARAAGHTYTAIAKAAGVSRQAVRELLTKEGKS